MGVALRPIPPCEEMQSAEHKAHLARPEDQKKRGIPVFLYALNRFRQHLFLVIAPLPGKGNSIHLPHQAKLLQQPDEGAREIHLPPVQPVKR